VLSELGKCRREFAPSLCGAFCVVDCEGSISAGLETECYCTNESATLLKALVVWNNRLYDGLHSLHSLLRSDFEFLDLKKVCLNVYQDGINTSGLVSSLNHKISEERIPGDVKVQLEGALVIVQRAHHHLAKFASLVDRIALTHIPLGSSEYAILMRGADRSAWENFSDAIEQLRRQVDTIDVASAAVRADAHELARLSAVTFRIVDDLRDLQRKTYAAARSMDW
jgi:hypothetical protein